MVEDILDIPDGLWCPATSKTRPVGTSYMNNHKTKTTTNNILESETKNSRLLQAYVQYRAPDGTTKRGRIQVDTQSNINYVLSKYALPRSRRVWEAEYAVGISGKTIKLGRSNTFTVVKDGQPIVIDTVRGEPSMFKNGCIALLGVDAIATLGIDLNYHMDSLKHLDVKYRESTKDNAVCIRAKEQALAKYPAYK